MHSHACLCAGDEVMAGVKQVDPARYAPFFTCAQQVEATYRLENQTVVWLFISDSQQLRDWAKQQFPDRVLVPSTTPKHVSRNKAGDAQSGGPEAMRAAAAEHWLLSMSDYFVQTWWSGFSRTAYWRSMTW